MTKQVKKIKKKPKKCGAKTRSGGVCQKWAMPNGRCRLHGGLSTGPKKGTKNALTTGAAETIITSQLSKEEQEAYHQVETDEAKALDEEIRLITIRESRMLRRIEEHYKKRRELDDMVTMHVERNHTVDEDGKQRLESIKERLESVHIFIMQCEDALTRVQQQKMRLINLKRQHEQEKLDEDAWTDQLRALSAVLGTAETDTGTDTPDQGSEEI